MTLMANQTSAFCKDRLFTERRIARRYPASIGIIFPKAGDLNFCRIAEVSASGAFLETDQTLAIGEKISFAIAGNNLGLPLEGVVARRLNARQSHTGRAGIGVRFLNQDNDFPTTRDDLVLYLLNYPYHTMWEKPSC